MKLRVGFSLRWLAALTTTVAPLCAQIPPPPEPSATGAAIKVERRVVLVDVVVANNKGEPVPGLHKEDFVVSEEGESQRISSFEEHKGVQASEVKLPAMPPNVFTNFPTVKSADSVNILLIDLLNTQPPDQAIVRKQVIKYLSSVPSGTRLAVFALGQELRLVRGFTTDFSGLTAVLDDKKLGVNPEVARQLPTDSQQYTENLIVHQMRRSQAAPAAVDAFSQFLRDEAANRSMSRVDLTLRAFQAMARYLSGIPARKNLIWFSDNFPISFFPDSRVRGPKHQENVQRTSDLLTAAQVAIYPVSALGVAGDPTFDVSDIAGTREQLIAKLNSSQISMETIAEETGGHAFYNTNALSDAVQEAVSIGSQYYTLAYSPADNKTDGRFRRIQVSLASGNYKLSYRRGYYADKPLAEPHVNEADGDPLLPLIGLGMPNFDQILYKVQVTPKDPQPPANAPRAGTNLELKPPFVRYDADFAVVLQDLGMKTGSDGAHHGHIEVMVIAFDREGRILNILKKKAMLDLNAQAYAATRAVGLQIHEEIDVPPGEVYLRTGLFDLNTGNCGTVGTPLGMVSATETDKK